jgi:hypothetical protein
MLATPVVVALRQAGRIQEASDLARDGLAAGTLEGRDRSALVRVAIDAAIRQNDWSRVELLTREELGRFTVLAPAQRGEHFADYTWLRIEALRILRRLDAAADVLKTSGVVPDDTQRLTTWAQVVAHNGFAADDVDLLLRTLEVVAPETSIVGRLLGLAWSSFTLVDAANRNAAKDAARAAAGAAGEVCEANDEDDLEPDEVDLDDEAVLATAEGRASRALHQALEAHRAQHGEIPGISVHVVEEGDEGVVKLIEELTAMLRRQAEALDNVRRLVRAGQPLGLIASVAHRPYSRAVIGRVLGYVPAVTSDEASFDEEVEAAAAAIGGAVVVEASTLHIVERLNRPALTGEFTELLLSERARDDIIAGVQASRADLGSSASMGFDLVSGRPTMTDGPYADASLLVTRAEALELLSRDTRIVKVDDSRYAAYAELFADDSDDAEEAGAANGAGRAVHADDQADEADLEVSADLDGPGVTEQERAEALGPWADAIEIAVAESVPLWSDDLGLRVAARHRGVTAFSTAALLEALLDNGRLVQQDVPPLRAALLRAGVADLDVTDDELHILVDQAAEVRETEPTAARELITAVGMKLSRPSYAQARPATVLTDARALIAAAAAYEASWAETFVVQTLTCLAVTGLPGSEVLRAAISLSLGGTPFIDAARTARYLELARQVVIGQHGDDLVSEISGLLAAVLSRLPERDAFISTVLETLLPRGFRAAGPSAPGARRTADGLTLLRVTVQRPSGNHV